MSSAKTIPDRVMTRWCGPNPFGLVSPVLVGDSDPVQVQDSRVSTPRDRVRSPRRGMGKVPGSETKRRRASNKLETVRPKPAHVQAAARLRERKISTQQDLGGALVELLHVDLQRGYWRVAIRHYLMLIGCGYEVPTSLQQECVRKMAVCSPVELQKIIERVSGWCDLRAEYRRQINLDL